MKAIRRGKGAAITARAAQFRDLYMKLRIEEQLRWYASRRDEYKKANRQAIVVHTVLLTLAALAGVVAPLATTTGRFRCGRSARPFRAAARSSLGPSSFQSSFAASRLLAASP